MPIMAMTTRSSTRVKARWEADASFGETRLRAARPAGLAGQAKCPVGRNLEMGRVMTRGDYDLAAKTRGKLATWPLLATGCAAYGRLNQYSGEHRVAYNQGLLRSGPGPLLSV